MKRLQRLHERVLHEIFGLATNALPPQGQPEEPIHMRHRLRLEGSPESVRRREIGVVHVTQLPTLSLPV